MQRFTGDNADLNEVLDKSNANNSSSVEMNYDFKPNNPYTLSVDAKSLGESEVEPNEVNAPGLFKTVGAEAKEFNITAQAISAGYNKFEEPSSSDDLPPPGWNPKSDPSKYANIYAQYYPYLFEATGPKDLDYRIQRAMSEQDHDETLANGSMAARILGGVAGIATDPISYIPIIGLAKYGRFAPSVLKNAARVFPGIAVYSIAQSAAQQSDRINGNLTDFFKNAAINTVFGTATFGALGAAGLTLDHMNLWNLRKFAKPILDGVDFKLNIDEEGKLTGITAFDGANGSAGAKAVSYAQDLADSSFSKSGVFKVPYLGEALLRTISNPAFGTPLLRLLTSPYKTARGFYDRVMDHNIITTGLAEGKTSPVKFETLMKRQFSDLRLMQAQMNSLHLERNGFDLTNRVAQGITGSALYLKNKGLEVLGKDLDKSSYVSKEQFYNEIEDVLLNEKPSDNASVNSAASMLREKIDTTYKNWREAYNLPESFLPPKTATGYLMRVYNTAFLNNNENKWVSVISNWLKDADETITSRMQPINDIQERISNHQQAHEQLIREGKAPNEEIKNSLERLNALKIKHKTLNEQLQNELRSNPDLQLHVEDWNGLSADEAKELQGLTKLRDSYAKDIEKQKDVISKIKEEASKRKTGAMKAKTMKTGKKNLKESDKLKLFLKKEQDKLRELEKLHDDEVLRIQESIHNNEVNPRLYYKEKGSERYILRDPNERLKFRDTYESHYHREVHAKAAYDSIMNQTAEDTINQIMGRLTGKQSENPIKERTLLVPDKLLYENGFMSKDLMAKVSNYVTHLSRRTNLKNVFKDVSVDGGIEPIIEEVQNEFENNRSILNEAKERIEIEITKNEDPAKAKILEKNLSNIDKELTKETSRFDREKKNMNHIYEKMMGMKKSSRGARMAQSAIMSLTAIASLPWVPFTMINDLSAAGLQHGIWPYLRDGLYPVVQSLGGLIKTEDSISLRKTAPNVSLALQDLLNGYADKNWSMFTEPYLNLGKIVGNLEKVAHFSSNFTLTNYIDNGLQRLAGAICQGEFMRILHAYTKGTITEKESLYLRKYGIDPAKWADRMVAAFQKDGGGITKAGGYQSLFWKWSDMEAANEFSNAVYRGIQSTTIQRGLADSPFWADNVIGSIVHGFNGWTYASLNRYVIPSMQYADAQKLVGVLFMLGTGYFVSPFRRVARGLDPFPPEQTDKQRLFETIQDSGYFSWFMNVLADANVLSQDRLLGDLKNDRYRDRTRAGLLGPSFGTANRMVNIIDAAASGEMNEVDLKNMFRMIPMMNASWTWWMSQKLVESLGLPKNRAAAHASNG